MAEQSGGPIPTVLPDRVPAFVVAAGRAVGHDLPTLEFRQNLLPWRGAIGGKGPFFVRLEADELSALDQVRRLSTVGELWLEAPLRDVDAALDLLVAGAARLVVPMTHGDAEMVDAVGPSAIIAWDGQVPWAEVQAAALAHEVPVLARSAPPEGAACDVFRLGDGPRPALERVASAPEPTPPSDGEAE